MRKKIVLVAVVSSVFLSGCSSPPKPISIDMSAPTTYLNNVYSQTQVSRVPLNKGDHNGKSWRHSYINLDREDYIAPQEKVRFFYFAHHADSIDLYGLPSRTALYRYWLQANGARGEIREHYLALSPRTVNIVFTREQENEKN